MLDLIVSQPACGRHLAGRLIDYFGADDSGGTLRDRMAEAFRTQNYEIRPMLKVLFTAPEFYAPKARGAKVKGPVRLLVGACRDLRLEGSATPSLAQLTAQLGPGAVQSADGQGLAVRDRLDQRQHIAAALPTG